MEYMSFKSTHNRTYFRLVREVGFASNAWACPSTSGSMYNILQLVNQTASGAGQVEALGGNVLASASREQVIPVSLPVLFS